MGQTLAPTMAIWEVVFMVRFRSSGSRGPSSSYRSSYRSRASDDRSCPAPAPRHGPSVLSMS
jgi:hypothetical protein